MRQLLWILALAALPAAGAERPNGEAVYTKWCAPCHDPGIEHAGTHALQAKYNGALPAVLREWPHLEAEHVKATVRHGISIMPPFRKTEITDQELDALAKWLAR